MPETIEGEATEVRSDLAVRKDTAPAQWTPSFAIAIDEAVTRVEQKHDFFKRVMREGDHYGVIPGTGTKPTLLKPGAELLLANMGLNAEFSDAEPPTLDILGAEHNGEPFIRYRRVCRIYRQLGPTEDERMLVGKAEGACSSWEAKYRYRSAAIKCPNCGKETIKRSKFDDGDPFYCFRKIGGCGKTFGAQQFEGVDFGKVPNPDIADSENTILKMADKRALVAATLIATGCSDIFTQDLEPAEDPDTGSPSPAGDRTAPAAAAPPKAQPAAKEPAKNTVPADLGSFFDQDETPIFVPPAADAQAEKRAAFAKLKEHDADTRLNANDRMRLYMTAAGVANRTNLKSLDAAKRVLAAYENAFKDLNEADAALETAIQSEIPL